MKRLVASALVLAMLAGCDVPAGSAGGDSAGNNQPNSAAEVCNTVAGGGEPAGQLSDGQFIYDIYAELQDEDCNVVTLAGGPLRIYVTGNINGEPAQYMDTADRSKTVDSPYHMSAFVKPRNAPHDMIVLVAVTGSMIPMIHNETEAEFVHCRILRDRAPIVTARGSRDRVSDTQLIKAPFTQANCHFTVGVG